MKTFFNIDKHDVELYKKKEKYIKNFVVKFYNKIKDKPNVLSPSYLESRRDVFFRTNIWDNKSFLTFPHDDTLFGLKSGIFIEQTTYTSYNSFSIYFVYGKDSFEYVSWNEPEFHYGSEYILNKIKSKSRFKNYSSDDLLILKEFLEELNSIAKKFDSDILKELNDEKIKAKIEKEQLKASKKSILQELDKDSNGEIDLIENDFNKLLSKYQKQVIGIDKNYIHQFVKVSNYIKTKKSNIQKIFESIEKTSSKEELDERLNLLRNQIHTYELLVFHSINMISALVSADLITFYEIYESFDKIGIYNSNWENEVSDKLSNIGNKLDDLLLSIYEMENKIVSEISNLSYVTQESFSDLNNSVTANLKDINSSIDVNNLFTAINTYQLYKINKQTKPLLPKN